MKKLSLILVVLVILLVGCGPTGPTVEDTWDELIAMQGNYTKADEPLKAFRQIVPSEDIPEHIWDACEAHLVLSRDGLTLIGLSVMEGQAVSPSDAEIQSKFDQANFALETCRVWFTQELGK